MQPAPAAAPSSQMLCNAYSALLKDLNDAYWAAGTLAAKDQIRGYSDIVTDVMTQLIATDLSTRNAAYTALQAQVGSVSKQLQTLQQQINNIISKINTAAAIVTDIAKVVSVAAQLFAHV